jgi:hypothetical protein
MLLDTVRCTLHRYKGTSHSLASDGDGDGDGDGGQVEEACISSNEASPLLNGSSGGGSGGGGGGGGGSGRISSTMVHPLNTDDYESGTIVEIQSPTSRSKAAGASFGTRGHVDSGAGRSGGCGVDEYGVVERGSQHAIYDSDDEPLLTDCSIPRDPDRLCVIFVWRHPLRGVYVCAQHGARDVGSNVQFERVCFRFFVSVYASASVRQNNTSTAAT